MQPVNTETTTSTAFKMHGHLLDTVAACLGPCAILVLIALLMVAFVQRNGRGVLGVPGPCGLPFLGFAHIFKPQGSPHLKLAQLSQAYGPIFQLRLGSQHVLVLSSVDIVKEALILKSCAFAGRPPLYSLVSLLSAGRTTVFAAGTDEVEATALQSLRIKQIAEGAMASVFTNPESLCERLNNILQELKNDFLNTQRTNFDPGPLIDQAIAELMFKMIFGESLPRQYIYESQRILRQLKVCLAQAGGVLIWADYVPFSRLLYRREIKQLANAITVFIAFVQNICSLQQTVPRLEESCLLHTLRNRPVSQSCRSFTEGNLVLEQITQQLNEQTLSSILAEIFVAGYQKISTAMRWGVMYLASNPQFQRDIQEEIRLSVGNTPLCLQDKDKFTFLEATVLETLRLSSSTPLTLPHHTTKDTSLSVYNIPKGTTVLVNLWACNRDPEYFDCPARFNPYRFLDNSSRKLVKTCPFLSFSTGARKCIGDVFSKSVLILTFGSLLREFQFELSFKSSLEGDYGLTIQPPMYKIKALNR